MVNTVVMKLIRRQFLAKGKHFLRPGITVFNILRRGNRRPEGTRKLVTQIKADKLWAIRHNCRYITKIKLLRFYNIFVGIKLHTTARSGNSATYKARPEEQTAHKTVKQGQAVVHFYLFAYSPELL